VLKRDYCVELIQTWRVIILYFNGVKGAGPSGQAV
jgi:hypothetical protein